MFNSFLLHAYYVPGIFIGAKNIVVTKTNKNRCPQGAYVVVYKDFNQNI